MRVSLPTIRKINGSKHKSNTKSHQGASVYSTNEMDDKKNDKQKSKEMGHMAKSDKLITIISLVTAGTVAYFLNVYFAGVFFL